MVEGLGAAGCQRRGRATTGGHWLTAPSFGLWVLASGPLKVAHAPICMRTHVGFLPDNPSRLYHLHIIMPSTTPTVWTATNRKLLYLIKNVGGVWGLVPYQEKIHNSPPLLCPPQYVKRFGGDIVEATAPLPSRLCGCRTQGGAEWMKDYKYQQVYSNCVM